jgi:catechol 2,3-dioxygenase-like lactoylglutathione lyase family enzyme
MSPSVDLIALREKKQYEFYRRLLKLLLLCSFVGPLAAAQDFSFTYDHFALEVQDLQKVGDYYGKVLMLEEIPHPSEPTGFRWFRIHGNMQLHLIGKDTVPVENRKSEHLCLSVSDLDAFIAHLEKSQVPYWDWPGKKGAVTFRADGVRQIYLKDPESNWIEINTAEH